MKVKRTYGKSTVALNRNSDCNESVDAFDKLLLNDDKTFNTKLSVKDKIRASFNRDSSLDETKIQKSKKKAAKTKKQQKQKSGGKKLSESSHDEFYESYLRGKKQKRSLKKKQMKSVSNVQISTPLQKQLHKKHLALEFKLSPIKLDDSDKASLENIFPSNTQYDSLKKQRLKEIEEAQKDLDSTATRDAKQLLEKIRSQKTLRSSENIQNKPDEENLKTKVDSPTIFKRQQANSRKLIKAVAFDETLDCNHDDEKLTSRSSFSSLLIPFHVPSIVIQSPPESPKSPIENSVSHQSENKSKENSSPAIFSPRTGKEARTTRASKRRQAENSPLALDVVKPKPKKSVAINLVPAVKDVSYYHLDTNDSTGDKNGHQTGKKSLIFSEDLRNKLNIELNSGKWRRSLIAWRSNQSAIKKSTMIPEESKESSMRKKSYAEKVLKTIEHSVLLEQSDDGTLQTALSILDASIKSAATFHDQRKTSQRETSVFQRSSIFYGLQEPVINVDSEPASLSARQIALRRCGQQEPLPFDEIYSESQLPNCCKIGEGVYGEVFMYKCPTTHQPIVLKIIPIEGDLLVNGEPQKRFDEILQEIVISMELSGMRHGKDYATDGFVNVKRVTCVQGAYPEHLIDEWELYRDNRAEGSDNDHPEIFPFDQLYVVFELCNGGRDLEAFVFNNAEEAQSIFLQTALTLAVAERKFEFEHRDLHWGNVLIAPTTEKFAEFRVDGKVIKLPTHGVKVTIIDYSLSRMVYDGAILFDNLARDEELFQSTGDYQFDIYRLMRDRVENNFERYEPFTNVLWLHYIVDKLINGARYRYSKTKKHRAAINDMMLERDELLNFTSAFDYIETLEL